MSKVCEKVEKKMGGGIGGFGVSSKKSCAIYSELESSLKILGGIVSVGKSSSRSLCFLFVCCFLSS
jgi:hypothetical protein